MINGVVVREQDAFTDYRGDLYTVWKDDDFDLNFKPSPIFTDSDLGASGEILLEQQDDVNRTNAIITEEAQSISDGDKFEFEITS